MSLEPYKQFVASRMAAGESAEAIKSQLESLFLPLEELCAFCTNKAELLCDFVIGFEKAGVVHVPSRVTPQGTTKPYEYDYVSIDSSETFTCDARLCEECSTQGHPRFFCGQACDVFVPDYCKEHTGQREGLNVITREEAQAIRNQMMMRVLASHPLLSRE